MYAKNQAENWCIKNYSENRSALKIRNSYKAVEINTVEITRHRFLNVVERVNFTFTMKWVRTS